MRHLLNTLFITSEDAYLRLDGENVVVDRDREEVARFPLHTLQQIVCFSYAGATPALMGACVKRDVGLSFCTPGGKFLARSAGVGCGTYFCAERSTAPQTIRRKAAVLPEA